LASAREACARIKRSIRENGHPGLIDDGDSVTVQKLTERYLEQHVHRHLKPKTAGEYERLLRREVLPLWGQRKAASIQRSEVKWLLQQIVDRGPGQVANYVRRVLHAMYNWAIEEAELLDKNPCLGTKPPVRAPRRDRVLSPEEIASFWQGIDSAEMSDAMKNVLRFLLLTAQRESEVLEARWAEINLADRSWTIPSDKTKNGELQIVPLGSTAMEILKRAQRRSNGSDFVFPSPIGNQPMAPASVSRAVRNSRKAICLNDFRPHDLRRTAASMFARLGVPQEVIRKLLNHKDYGVTAIYNRYAYDKEKRDALETWDRRLRDIVENYASTQDSFHRANIRSQSDQHTA
jgi:integrase